MTRLFLSAILFAGATLSVASTYPKEVQDSYINDIDKINVAFAALDESCWYNSPYGAPIQRTGEFTSATFCNSEGAYFLPATPAPSINGESVSRLRMAPRSATSNTRMRLIDHLVTTGYQQITSTRVPQDIDAELKHDGVSEWRKTILDYTKTFIDEGHIPKSQSGSIQTITFISKSDGFTDSAALHSVDQKSSRPLSVLNCALEKCFVVLTDSRTKTIKYLSVVLDPATSKLVSHEVSENNFWDANNLIVNPLFTRADT